MLAMICLLPLNPLSCEGQAEERAEIMPRLTTKTTAVNHVTGAAFRDNAIPNRLQKIAEYFSTTAIQYLQKQHTQAQEILKHAMLLPVTK